MWCGLEHTLEVFNMFSLLIPQEGLRLIWAGRKCQGLIPDFKIIEPNVPGMPNSETVLAKLKTLAICKTRYGLATKHTLHAITCHTSSLPLEYNKHAKYINQVYF